MTGFDISNPRLEVVSADVFSSDSMHTALQGADTVYYLVHMLKHEDADFYSREAEAAKIIGLAAKHTGVARIIYLSGLGRDDEKLSQHLASRHHTGDILRTHVPTVIEFRSSIIVGVGSLSFEIVRHLVDSLPIILLPTWSETLTQPIMLSDVLHYLVAGSSVSVHQHEIIEIGGPLRLSYLAFMRMYATTMGKRCHIVRIPILPGWVAGSWLSIFLPTLTARAGKRMVDSFRNEMTVTNARAKELFPDITPQALEVSLVR